MNYEDNVRAGKILSDFFNDMETRLTAGFKSTFWMVASNRTGSNREFVVMEFLKAIAPISIAVRHGAVAIDALGQSSRDIDLVLLNPWATPVWPHLHGIVPVEGLLCGVLVERDFTTNSPAWEQAFSVKQLLKSLRSTEGYKGDPTRTFRPDVGIWFWTGWEDESFRNALCCNWPNAKKGWEWSLELAESLGWTKTGETVDWKAEQLLHERVGGTLPTWIYFHNDKVLAVKFQKRTPKPIEQSDFYRLIPNRPEQFLLPTITDGNLKLESADEPAAVVNHVNHALESSGPTWGYALYKGKHVLPTLGLHVAEEASLYGQERVDFSRYQALVAKQYTAQQYSNYASDVSSTSVIGPIHTVQADRRGPE